MTPVIFGAEVLKVASPSFNKIEIVASAELRVWAEDMHVGQVLGSYIRDGYLKAAHLADFAGDVTWHYPNHHNLVAYDPSNGWQQKMSEQYR